jgi:hypothetical protein
MKSLFMCHAKEGQMYHISPLAHETLQEEFKDCADILSLLADCAFHLEGDRQMATGFHPALEMLKDRFKKLQKQLEPEIIL